VATNDPIVLVRSYGQDGDREIVGLITSSLAYGQIKRIQTAAKAVLEEMGTSPSQFIRKSSEKAIRRIFGTFRYRFTSSAKLCGLLLAIRAILHKDGSLESCFERGMPGSATNVLPGLKAFSAQLRKNSAESLDHLIPSPTGKTAFKRLNLFLRWMVRNDTMDLGSWRCVTPSQLIVPLDVHIHRVALALGWTLRRGANIDTAIEITDVLRQACSSDPLKYDFAIVTACQRGDPIPSPAI